MAGSVNSAPASALASGPSVAVIGAGGNIGSAFVPHLARLTALRRVILIDPDRYEERNRWSQDIAAADVGRAKVAVQARRLRRINPELAVEALRAPVQALALGRLRVDAVAACVDTREARRYVAEAAWRLGVPFIDTGIEPSGLLARVTVHLPGAEHACYLCPLDELDFALFEQAYACPGASRQAPTGGPSALGALAAALGAIELQKLLADDRDRLLVSRQLVLDAAWHRHLVTRLSRNPRCRFDHAIWSVEDLDRDPADLCLDELFDLARAAGNRPVLRFPGTALVRRLTCRQCGWKRRTFRLANRLGVAQRCRPCGGPLLATGFDMIGQLEEDTLPQRLRRRPLSTVGIQRDDIVTIASGAVERHLQLRGAPIASHDADGLVPPGEAR